MPFATSGIAITDCEPTFEGRGGEACRRRVGVEAGLGAQRPLGAATPAAAGAAGELAAAVGAPQPRGARRRRAAAARITQPRARLEARQTGAEAAYGGASRALGTAAAAAGDRRCAAGGLAGRGYACGRRRRHRAPWGGPVGGGASGTSLAWRRTAVARRASVVAKAPSPEGAEAHRRSRGGGGSCPLERSPRELLCGPCRAPPTP